MPGRLSIAALAERVKGLGGWRCRAAAVIAGAASVLALAPFFAWPILWFTLPALVWLTDGAIARGTRTADSRWYRRPIAAAAEIGWWFGFGYFLAGLFWIGEAFLVDADSFAFLMPFAVLLMPAGLALFHAAATALACCMSAEKCSIECGRRSRAASMHHRRRSHRLNPVATWACPRRYIN